MNYVYLICYSTEAGTYTSHIAYASKRNAEIKCVELMGKDGLDWYVVRVPLIYE